MKDKIIKKIKNWIYYIGCAIFLLALSFFDNITTYFPYITLQQLLCFGFLLQLTMLKIIEKKLTEQISGSIHTTLSSGLNRIVNEIPNIHTLNIYASSSRQIQPYFCSEGIHIKECNLNVHKDKESEEFNKRLNNILDDWKDLETKNIIEKLNIKFTYIKPTHYVILINKQFVLRGMYNFTNTTAQVSAVDPILICNNSEIETIEINKQYKWFTDFFENEQAF